MTDNRAPGQLSGISEQFTDEQVEAAAKAMYECGWKDLRIWGRDSTEEARDGYRRRARAALVAAQGAAPQAESVWFTGYGGTGVNKAAPALPSSDIDEDALAEEIGRHKLVHVSVSRKSAFCACDPSVTAGVDDNRAWFEGHRARAVAAWLKDGA